jgi:uncharacterized cofD-like protein
LLALRRLEVDITAIVATADDGGSTGRLRRDYGVVPPGDIRKALAALAQDPRLGALLDYRFPSGDVAGHTVGNLLMVAAADLWEGDLVATLQGLERLFAVRGQVIPATMEPLELIAEGPRGTVTGQHAITTTSGHLRVRLRPASASATPAAVEAVTGADLLLLGPGSLFTSILPNLAVPGLDTAIAAARAPLVLVANLREQPGETEGLGLAGHLDVIAEHLPSRRIDVVLQHDTTFADPVGAPLVAIDAHPHVRRFVRAPLRRDDDGHDPAALAAALRDLLG